MPKAFEQAWDRDSEGAAQGPATGPGSEQVPKGRGMGTGRDRDGGRGWGPARGRSGRAHGHRHRHRHAWHTLGIHDFHRQQEARARLQKGFTNDRLVLFDAMAFADAQFAQKVEVLRLLSLEVT